MLFLISSLFLAILSGDDIRLATDSIVPWLVRIETIGGHEKVGNEFASEGTSTGLLLSTEGFVITSAFHFLHAPTSILVATSIGTRHVARQVATDRNRMLTLLKIENIPTGFPSETPPLIIDQKAIPLGSPCIALGCGLDAIKPNIAVGIVSGKNRIWGKALQTDAAIGPNNYGGPLIDRHGNLLGIMVPLSMFSAEDVAAGSEFYDAGVGLAIPFADVSIVVERLKNGVDLEQGESGIIFRENRVFIGDAVIDDIMLRSPAEKSGLEKGDKIIEIDGKKMSSALEVAIDLRRRYSDEKLTIRFLRKNDEKATTLQMNQK
ncbi:MAG: S1C family serine protease [Thermoguttaceae bacterium]